MNSVAGAAIGAVMTSLPLAAYWRARVKERRQQFDAALGLPPQQPSAGTDAGPEFAGLQAIPESQLTIRRGYSAQPAAPDRNPGQEE